MATITKKEMIDRIAEITKAKRVLVRKILQAFLDEIVEELGNGNRLEFRDFGVFESRERAERVAQNPKTLERVTVPSRRTVKFKIGRSMRAKMIESRTQIDEATGLPLEPSSRVTRKQTNDLSK